MSIKMKVFCSSDKGLPLWKVTKFVQRCSRAVPWYEYVPVIRGTVISNE